ncbi:monovalent cation/H(+) antiporter subunit G [Shouchella patagoniensis]|uniref:monovalent cation/H(+) antiporter subunit G n=1 Tax=Shouchella patagoniensis TaxID=228576 RepID=UPI000994BF27|nr:monovalent cation/H(+) antiporter subunit G [Shouchella patagoniensis]
MTTIEWIISILALLGSIFGLLAALGIIRLPDVYSRLHATGKNSTFGIMMIMSATFLYFLTQHNQFIGKLLLTILFVFITVPIAALVISRSAYRTGIKMHSSSVRDDMKPFYEEEAKRNNEKPEMKQHH